MKLILMVMVHRRYYIETLRASGVAVLPIGGDLLVVARDSSDDIDWELVYRSKQRHQFEQGPYDLDMEGPEGRFEGPGILVRSDGRSHVFRGVGALSGFNAAEFGGD